MSQSVSSEPTVVIVTDGRGVGGQAFDAAPPDHSLSQLACGNPNAKRRRIMDARAARAARAARDARDARGAGE